MQTPSGATDGTPAGTGRLRQIEIYVGGVYGRRPRVPVDHEALEQIPGEEPGRGSHEQEDHQGGSERGKPDPSCHAESAADVSHVWSSTTR